MYLPVVNMYVTKIFQDFASVFKRFFSFAQVIYICNYSPPGNILFRGRDGITKPLPAYEVSPHYTKL
jgi:hypothetical protein